MSPSSDRGLFSPLSGNFKRSCVSSPWKERGLCERWTNNGSERQQKQKSILENTVGRNEGEGELIVSQRKAFQKKMKPGASLCKGAGSWRGAQQPDEGGTRHSHALLLQQANKLKFLGQTFEKIWHESISRILWKSMKVNIQVLFLRKDTRAPAHTQHLHMSREEPGTAWALRARSCKAAPVLASATEQRHCQTRSCTSKSTSSFWNRMPETGVFNSIDSAQIISSCHKKQAHDP